MTLAFSRTRLFLLAILLALLGVGVWTYQGAAQSLRELRGAGLRTLLDTQAGTLDQWLAEQRHEAERLAGNSLLRPDLDRLLASRGEAGAAYVAAALQRGRTIGVTAVLVTAPDGQVLAGSDPGPSGHRAGDYFTERIRQAALGQAVFVRPDRRAGSATDARCWMAVPIWQGSRIAAVLALGSDPGKAFSALFESARLGDSGESLAFDADGWMVSSSRHDGEIGARGLSFRLALPGGDGSALTASARKAVALRGAGGDGLELQAYANHLGRDVIGAWRWRDDLDMGIIVEIEAAEAYAPLGYLQAGFAILLLMLFAVWLAGFLSPNALSALLRRGGLGQVGPYRLVRQIGEGSISNVYLARHRMLKRPAAVKILKQHSTSEEWTNRFRREVQLCSQLSHPNTISIYDYGVAPGGALWYAMEYLDGISLADLVERYGPVPPARTAHILRQACAALAETHSCGLVHRDIKPQNLMLCDVQGERDFVKLLDFGLVKQIDGDATQELTAHMRILGTPLYMSPERIRNPADADARADIYALGAVGFYLLTGQRLFDTETGHDLTYHVLHVTPRPVSECSTYEIPAELDALIGRCLEKDASARPQTIAAVAGALDSILEQSPWTRRQIDAWWQQHLLAEGEPARRLRVG